MWSDILQLLIQSFWETIFMVTVSSIIGTLFGLPLGIILYLTDKNSIWQHMAFNRTLGIIVNALRSIPFIILLVVVMPLTRLIVGTSIGTMAAIVPLTLSAIPFIARLIEASVREVDRGLIEAAQSMGATTYQVVTRILLPEAWPSMIAALTITFIALVGYSAMAGAIGGGGLGDLAIRYGYQRYEYSVVWGVVLVLIVFVQIVQSLGDWLVRRVNHR